jgi:hypothetical protein
MQTEIAQLPSSKANSSTKDLNKSVEEEILNNEFQKTIVKLINELNEEIQKLVLTSKRLEQRIK